MNTTICYRMAAIVLVSVAITACANGDSAPNARAQADRAQGAPRVTAEAPKYRFVKPPVVVYAHFRPFSRDNIGFATYARLNRKRPRNGNLLLNGLADMGEPYRESTKRYCYSQRTSDDLPPDLRHPRLRNHQRVTVELTSRSGRTLAEAHVRVRRVKLAKYDRPETFARALGCIPLHEDG